LGVHVGQQRLQSYGNRELLKVHCKLNVHVCVLQSIRMFVLIACLYPFCLRLHMCFSSGLPLGPGAKERIPVVTVGEFTACLTCTQQEQKAATACNDNYC